MISKLGNSEYLCQQSKQKNNRTSFGMKPFEAEFCLGIIKGISNKYKEPPSSVINNIQKGRNYDCNQTVVEGIKKLYQQLSQHICDTSKELDNKLLRELVK